jgi:uncharacterized protein
MRIVRPSNYVTKPWKNGRGTTREIACFPEGASYDAFAWRLSAARVEQSGPFSCFAGIDRSMLLLSGTAMTLHGEGASVTLTPKSEAHSFAGEHALQAALAACDSPVEDLNLMTRRETATHTMKRFHATTNEVIALVAAENETVLLFMEAGDALCMCETNASHVGSGDTIRIERLESCTLRATSETRTILMRITMAIQST